MDIKKILISVVILFLLVALAGSSFLFYKYNEIKDVRITYEKELNLKGTENINKILENIIKESNINKAHTGWIVDFVKVRITEQEIGDVCYYLVAKMKDKSIMISNKQYSAICKELFILKDEIEIQSSILKEKKEKYLKMRESDVNRMIENKFFGDKL